jgi:hypothetical protein
MTRRSWLYFAIGFCVAFLVAALLTWPSKPVSAPGPFPAPASDPFTSLEKPVSGSASPGVSVNGSLSPSDAATPDPVALGPTQPPSAAQGPAKGSTASTQKRRTYIVSRNERRISPSAYQGKHYDARFEPIRRCIVWRESNGQYRVRSRVSTASGAYQFIDGTWRNNSGLSAPASAHSRYEQDRVFWKLWNHGKGWRHWWYGQRYACWSGPGRPRV